MPDSDFYGDDLATWLQEAGRRRRAPPATQRDPVSGNTAAAMPAAAPAAAKRTYVRHPRELLLIALAALAFLPYFFADVQVQIACLPRVIVFV